MRQKLNALFIALMHVAFYPAAAIAAALPCSEEYGRMNEASLLMASPDLKPEAIEEAQRILDEWQPKYDACVSDYGERNGADARADLEVRLAAGGQS